MKIDFKVRSRYKLIIFFASIIVMFCLAINWVNYALASDDKSTSRKDGEHLVNIYEKGNERAVVTKAKTIREALKSAKVDFDEKHDVVEPALDTELIASKYNINIYRARPVVVIDGTKRLKITTAHQTPALIAKNAGVVIYPEDKTTLRSSDNLFADGASLMMSVERAPIVYMTLYGKKVELRSWAKTVGELLKEKNIAINKEDTLTVDSSTKVITGMSMELWRNGKQTVTNEEDIDFPVEKIQDANRESGYREVKEYGNKGKKNVTYEIEMKNGKEISRKEIASVTTKESKKQVEVVGIKNNGDRLTKAKGVNIFIDRNGISHRETYYDLPMTAVMRNCGAGGYYSVRSDGAKIDVDGFVIVAANLGIYRRCSVVQTSLGLAKVYDTGGFVTTHPHGYDLATNWSKYGDK